MMTDDGFNPFTLKGKTVFVTGASSGIGRSIAVTCSQMGAKVIISGRSKERLERTKVEMSGEGHEVLAADLTSVSDVQSLLSAIPVLDGIVYSAGIGQRKLCKMLTEEDVDEVNSFS